MINTMKKFEYISPEVEYIIFDGADGMCQASKNDEYKQIGGGSWDV